MDFFDDILLETAAAPAPRSKFQPKAKPRLKKVPAAASQASKEHCVTPSVDTYLNQKAPEVHDVTSKNVNPSDAHTDFGKSVGEHVDVSHSQDSDHVIIDEFETLRDVQSDFHHLTGVSILPLQTFAADYHDIVNWSNGSAQEAKTPECSTGLDPLEMVFEAPTAGAKACKFLPKPKAHKTADAVKFASHSQDCLTVPLNNPDHQYTDISSDFPSTTLDDSYASQLNDPSPASAVGVVGDTENSSLPPGEGELPYDFVVELDEDHGDGQYCQVVSGEPIEDEILHDDGDVHNLDSGEIPEAEKTTKHKGRTRKSTKDLGNTVGPVTKRRKAGELQDKIDKKPPRKFSRSTRRKRTVDKSLLEKPEHEIDFQKLPIRDLIILAEFKEHAAEKEAAAAKPATTDQRSDDRNTLMENSNYFDEVGYQSEQERDIPSSSRVQTDASIYNYMSHMNRTPTVRWSKQDTELFYQGVRQFGSDLSMIQQLFPGRSRHQIKLKYKKEERQQPMSLMDALTNRCKDYTHFELVIGRLQEQINLEEENNLRVHEDDSATVGDEGEDADGTALETQEVPSHDLPGKTEIGEDIPADAEADAGNPWKVNDADDGDGGGDDYLWTQYNK